MTAHLLNRRCLLLLIKNNDGLPLQESHRSFSFISSLSFATEAVLILRIRMHSLPVLFLSLARSAVSFALDPYAFRILFDGNAFQP